jgi:hypothetical protein
MSIRHIIITTIVAAGFSFAVSAAPIAQAPTNSKSAITLVKSKGGRHMGRHHMHRGHWRHHRRHHHMIDGPFCVLSLAPWCWR